MNSREQARGVVAILCLAAILPFVPGTLEFLRRGVPDVLFTGDGAALELGTLHARHGAQLVGPYSRFGWSHPGPAFFYLAVPVYELFGERGPALNVFAFLANAVMATATVLVARQLRGAIFALAVAALLSIYELAALPFLLANEWNPIFPILPLALLFFLTARLSLGASTVLPAFAFVASLIVQTHIGYAPAVIALCAFAFFGNRGRRVDRRWVLPSTIAILILCWLLPLYEAAVERPGNLQRLIAFFVPKNLAQHSWSEAVTTVVHQMAVMPWALVQTVYRRPLPAPALPIAIAFAAAQVTALSALAVWARRHDDATLKSLSMMVLVQIAVAVLAVRAIRGEVLFYLVTWISLLGLLSLVAMAACPKARFAVVPAQTAAAALSAILLALALAGPVVRGSVIRPRDDDAEQIARAVQAHLLATRTDRPTVRMVSREVWPTAVAVVLFLHKQGIPVYVEREWAGIVGKPLIEPPGSHPALLFGDAAFKERARTRGDLTFIAATPDVGVFLEFPRP
jgi:hypothetical protein